MYIPDHFRPTDADVDELLGQFGAADLITATSEGMLATMLPLIHELPGSAPEAGDRGRLLGHVARNNRQWRVSAEGEALVIVRGPDAYISPSWYATKREHGRVVPTWNYITAHIHGRLIVHDDPAWVETNVRALVARHESRRAKPWSVDDAPHDYFVGVPRAGRWRVRFNSDWDGYDPEFETVDSLDADTESERQDGMPLRIGVGLGPYSAVILSQDE
jgi:transcriptional regulator